MQLPRRRLRLHRRQVTILTASGPAPRACALIGSAYRIWAGPWRDSDPIPWLHTCCLGLGGAGRDLTQERSKSYWKTSLPCPGQRQCWKGVRAFQALALSFTSAEPQFLHLQNGIIVPFTYGYSNEIKCNTEKFLTQVPNTVPVLKKISCLYISHLPESRNYYLSHSLPGCLGTFNCQC